MIELIVDKIQWRLMKDSIDYKYWIRSTIVIDEKQQQNQKNKGIE